VSWLSWLTPIILATQEAEVRRIEVQSQPPPFWIVERPYLKKPIKKRAGGVAQGVDPKFKPQCHIHTHTHTHTHTQKVSEVTSYLILITLPPVRWV
jgi:hypothetical protein